MGVTVISPEKPDAKGAAQIGPALDRLESDGFLVGLTEIGRGAYMASPGPHGWRAACREAARLLPGQVSPTTGNGGMRAQVGSRTLFIIIDEADRRVQKTMEAREIVTQIIPDGERKELPWAVGGCARMLLRWVGKPQPAFRCMERLLQKGAEGEPLYMYHDCTPGRYEHAEMWDVSACFFSLLSRLPSLHVTNSRRGLVWLPMPEDDAYKWECVKDGIAGSHALRNSLWGAALGSYRQRHGYTSARPAKPALRRGEKPEAFAARVAAWEEQSAAWPPGRVRTVKRSFGAGPFRGAALVVARTAWELCSMQSAEVGSVYSTVDSVTIRGGGTPELWQRFGLSVSLKHSGPADIVGRGCWRVGPGHTVPYYDGPEVPEGYTCLRHRSNVPHIPIEGGVIFPQWL